MSTIEVRIRTSEDTKSVRLCDWPMAHLDELILLLGSWGVSTDYGMHEQGGLTGQFTLTNLAAFFEVIAQTEEAL